VEQPADNAAEHQQEAELPLQNRYRRPHSFQTTRTTRHDTTRTDLAAAVDAESMRIPLSPKDMTDLRGFTNVVVEEGGEQL
jgi:hypothetical protein